MRAAYCRLVVLSVIGVLCAGAAVAAPAQVVILRHGEKPETGNELNERGWQRANALVGFFQSDPVMTRFGLPTAIYAMAPKDEGGSVRPIQTVTPLADVLKLAIHKDYKRDELAALVKEIMGKPGYAGRTVLVCWEHKVIPELVRDFGWSSGPVNWDGAVFDRAWVLRFDGDRVVGFQDLPQRLLPGDSDR